MINPNKRLVVLTLTSARVFEGAKCIAQFRIEGPITSEDVEEIRTTDYSRKEQQ